MKKYFVVCLLALALLLSACGNEGTAAISPTATSGEAQTPTATATPTPDFSGTDFSGRWYVFELIDSNGVSVSDTEKQILGAGFILELLPSGTYFVYDQDSKVLGQGTYSVALNQLILTAATSETAYEILDADTLRITQPDTSITVMKREIQETEDDINFEDEPGDAVQDDNADPATTEGEEPDSTPTPAPEETPAETAE